MSTSAKALVFSVTMLSSAAVHAQVDQIMTWHGCTSTNPAANEVYVYTATNFGGNCAALYEGFYPNSGTGWSGFGLPNDSISSLKVGASVRARLFSAVVYGGSHYWFGGWGNYSSMPSGWNDVTSSIRVENNSRSVVCDDLRTGEFAVFRDANFANDCVVLYYTHQYPTPISMGIANDSISSIDPGDFYGNPTACDGSGSQYWIAMSKDQNFPAGQVYGIHSGDTPDSYLGDYQFGSYNDVVSGISASNQVCFN